MSSLPKFSVNNPVLINLFMSTLLVSGAYGGFTLIREMFPDSQPNRALIQTDYPGATPSEVEKGIALKIEEKIKDVRGVENVNSTISEGRSVIMVELESGFDKVDEAVRDIESSIDTIPREDFPEDAKETQVSDFVPRWPVISVAVYGELTDRELKEMGERLRDEILALPSVTDVTLEGTRKDEISVEVSPERLAQFHLSFMDVADAIASSNLDIPGGQLRTSSSNVSVRTLGEKDRGKDLYDIVIRSDADGGVVKLKDVATIIDGFEDVDVIGRFNGQPSVQVTVYKTPEQDAIAIASVVKALVAGKTGDPLVRPWSDKLLDFVSGKNDIEQIYEQSGNNPFPDNVKIEAYMDLSRFIEDRLDLLKRNGFWGLVLVALSLLFFLHWRVALHVMMGLILSIAGSLICMKLMGQTLNLITMFGLIIVLGLLVDDAIIVAENIYSKIEQGIEPRLAAIKGAEEVTWPVGCAVATTIVAFLPLMFIEGQLGEWMGVLPIIVCVALSVSLIEALTILPAHLSHGLKRVESAAPKVIATTGGVFGLRSFSRKIRSAQESFVQKDLRVWYEKLLRKATRNRYVTMASFVAMLLVVFGLYLGNHVPMVFLLAMDSETVVANMTMGVGTSIDRSGEAIAVVEQAAKDLPECSSTFTLIGLHASMNFTPTSPQSHLAQVFLELTPTENRDRTSADITKELREKTADIPGVEKLSYASAHGGPGGMPIHLEISGDNVEDLRSISTDIKARLLKFVGVFDIMDDYDAGQREVQIELFESARALGLTTELLATQVRSAFYGFEARKVQRGREDVKIMVRYPLAYRTRVYDIESMRIKTPVGMLVPFTEVARLTEGTGFSTIKRKNQVRTITITADVDENKTEADRILTSLERDFPDILEAFPGTSLVFGGEKLETKKSFASLETDFAAAVLLIYVILAGLFKSYVQPMIVMAVIPFGLIGAVLGHLVMGYPLTMLSMIGLVALTGIVVNDSLVLVTFINQRIRDGSPPYEAVVEGGLARMRPILLTSATTILGIAPLLLERSFQARFLIPMGISISAGLAFATILTLIAIPSLYLIAIDCQDLLRRFRAWVLGRPLAETA